MTGHPIPVGSRVRHTSRQWSTEAFATVLQADYKMWDDTYEYRVVVDEDAAPNWPRSPDGIAWWSSRATVLGTTPPEPEPEKHPAEFLTINAPDEGPLTAMLLNEDDWRVLAHICAFFVDRANSISDAERSLCIRIREAVE